MVNWTKVIGTNADNVSKITLVPKANIAKLFGTAPQPAPRALFSGGYDGNASDATNKISYITITTLGNALSFGILTAKSTETCSCSSDVRSVCGRASNVIDYVTIASTGNATDFGDLTTITGSLAASSSNHGGLI